MLIQPSLWFLAKVQSIIENGTVKPKANLNAKNWMSLRDAIDHLVFFYRPEIHKLGNGHWDLASYQDSLNSVQRFQRRSRKCLSQSEARAAILFVHLSRRLKCTIVIMRCPSSVVNFSHFRLLLSSKTAEHNSTKLHRSQDLNVLYQVCVFRADRKNMMAALTSDWLIHFRFLLWNRWTELNETWQETDLNVLYQVVFFGSIGKQDGRQDLWLADIFDFSSKTAKLNSTKLHRKQDLNIFYQVGRLEKQDSRPCLLLAETFSTSPLKSLNRIQRNLTGSKI